MKIPLILFSHVAVGLMGWGIARELRPAVPPVQPENFRMRSNHPLPSVRGSDLVRSIEHRLKKSREAAAQAAAGPGAREKILAALTGLTLPPEPAASIRALLADKDEPASIRAAAIFALWAKSDPAAALEFASDRDEFGKMSCDDVALELVGETINPELALAMAKGNSRDPLFAGLARQLNSTRTVEELVTLMAGVEGDLKSSISFHIGDQWPAERIDDFGRLAAAMEDPEMLDRLRHKLPPEEMAKWMMRYVNELPDREFARSVTQTGTLYFLLRGLPGIPLEDRLAEVIKRPVYEQQSQVIARKDAMEFLAENDVSGFFNSDGPDLLYAFHHGKIEVPEILAQLSARFPEYAAAGLLPALLHQQLTAEDPERAAVLIADMPVEKQAQIIAKGFWSVDSLDVIGRALKQFPKSNDEAVLASRREIWRTVTDDGLGNYGQAYLRWISTLPDPQDRTMALEAIADRIDGSMDDHADMIRRIVGDTPLRDTP